MPRLPKGGGSQSGLDGASIICGLSVVDKFCCVPEVVGVFSCQLSGQLAHVCYGLLRHMFSTDPNHQLTLRQGTLHFQQVDQLSFQTTQAASHRRYLWSVQWIPMIPVCNSDCLLPFSKKAQYLDQTCESWTIGPGQKLIFLPVLCLYMSISIHFCTFPHFLIIAFWGSQSQIASDRMPMQQCALYIYVRLCILSLYIYLLTFTNLFIHLFIYLSKLFMCLSIYLRKLYYFTSLNSAAIWGWFPLLTMMCIFSSTSRGWNPPSGRTSAFSRMTCRLCTSGSSSSSRTCVYPGEISNVDVLIRSFF